MINTCLLLRLDSSTYRKVRIFFVYLHWFAKIWKSGFKGLEYDESTSKCKDWRIYLQFIKSILLKYPVIIWNYIGVICKEDEMKKNAKMNRRSL